MFKFNNKETVKKIRAKFTNGIIKPLEKLNLKEGEELKISISLLIKRKSLLEALEATGGAWKNSIDAEELKRNIYTDRLIKNRPKPNL